MLGAAHCRVVELVMAAGTAAWREEAASLSTGLVVIWVVVAALQADESTPA